MKYYLIAGEPSGDLHGSNLMKALKAEDTAAEFRFWGGDLMQQQGGTLVKHYRDLAFMGVFEVLANLRTIQRNFKLCEHDLLAWQPDVVILVDYPGFNLRMAEFAHNHGMKVFYYITPKIWAWNRSRVKKVKAFVDKLFTILPFETDFYKGYGMTVDYTGNPVLDAIDNRHHKEESFEAFTARTGLDGRPIVGLLAGSRRQELKLLLTTMLKMVPLFPQYQFVIAGAPSFTQTDYEPYIAGLDVKVLFGETYQIVQHARASMVASGTATLETALLGCPQVVCYRMGGGFLVDWLRPLVLKIPYVSLVNLVLNRAAVVELIQKQLNESTLALELHRLLNDDAYHQQQVESCGELQRLMGGPGSSDRTARLMVKYLNSWTESEGRK
ncbi:lipid-A-disaccharide synthase [Breznakibacter xylanolyticus]|uniref:Lipid-A-disaccharide synthase n=1 Tax=Breznakibacter xylanolyticus TaxID=990 RepID=A0A2W7N8N5_9BACT|nr:lipid-A-disaccharide synthase [Breznakibacter xylanolyticus]PZX14557.1 lipid-A-disaccharide synthase [Breznakibacter xylanolyticus]